MAVPGTQTPVGSTGSDLLTQYVNGSTTQNTTQAGSGTANSLASDQFTPGQQQLQGQSLGVYQGLLGGQNQQIAPQYMAPPQSVMDSYAMNYNKFVAPKLANAYGGGSSTIAGGLAEGLANISGQYAGQGMSNWLNTISNAAGLAFKPVGQQNNAGNTTQGQSSQTTNGWSQQTTADDTGLLQNAASALGGLFRP